MRPALRCRAALAALLAASVGSLAWATDNGQPAPASPIYGLTGDALAEQSLLAARWGAPMTSLRLDATAMPPAPKDATMTVMAMAIQAHGIPSSGGSGIGGFGSMVPPTPS